MKKIKLFSLALMALFATSVWADVETTYNFNSETVANLSVDANSDSKTDGGTKTSSTMSNDWIFGIDYLKGSSSRFGIRNTADGSNIPLPSDTEGDKFIEGTNTKSNEKFYIISKTAFGEIKSITLDITCTDKGKTGLRVIVCNDANFAPEDTTIIYNLTTFGNMGMTKNSNWKKDITLSSLRSNSGGYIKFELDGITSSGKYFALDNIRISSAPLVSHTLTWDFDGGNCSATAGTDYTAGGQVAEGATITYPANNTMTKDGYDFNGWSSSATTMPTSDLTITAQWVEHTLSSDATLADLTVDGVTVTGFAPATEEYNVELPFGTTVVPTVAGTKNDSYAKSVVVTQAASINGSATVVVTAEDNSTKTYTINFSVADSKVIDLVWKKDQSACAVAGSQAAVIKSNDASVSTYIKAITFDNVEGAGDDAAEGSSLNTGKKEGNTIIIQTQSGYLFKAMSFYGKIESEDTKCLISIDGGTNWSDIASTSGSDAAYCDAISEASTNDIRIKSNGAAGVWIRNMQLTIVKGSITPTAISNTATDANAVKRIENGQLFIEMNGHVYNAFGQTVR